MKRDERKEENDQDLPPYFPLKVKKCAIAADSFFTCFELHHKPVSSLAESCRV